jgi:hypothetical protein
MNHVPITQKQCPLIKQNCIGNKCALWVDDNFCDFCVFHASYFMLKNIYQKDIHASRGKDV